MPGWMFWDQSEGTDKNKDGHVRQHGLFNIAKSRNVNNNHNVPLSARDVVSSPTKIGGGTKIKKVLRFDVQVSVEHRSRTTTRGRRHANSNHNTTSQSCQKMTETQPIEEQQHSLVGIGFAPSFFPTVVSADDNTLYMESQRSNDDVKARKTVSSPDNSSDYAVGVGVVDTPNLYDGYRQSTHISSRPGGGGVEEDPHFVNCTLIVDRSSSLDDATISLVKHISNSTRTSSENDIDVVGTALALEEEVKEYQRLESEANDADPMPPPPPAPIRSLSFDLTRLSCPVDRAEPTQDDDGLQQSSMSQCSSLGSITSLPSGAFDHQWKVPQAQADEDIISSHEIENRMRRKQQLQSYEYKLNACDELHVIPCQCALSLMGMHGTTCHSSDSIAGDFSWPNFSSFLSPPPDHRPAEDPRSTISSMLNRLSSNISSKMAEAKNKEEITITPGTKTFLPFPKPPIPPPKTKTQAGVVRTMSGQARSSRRNITNKTKTPTSTSHQGSGWQTPSRKKTQDTSTTKQTQSYTRTAAGNNKILGISIQQQQPTLFADPSSASDRLNTPTLKSHKRSCSNTFVSIQYHEIMLICMEEDDEVVTTSRKISSTQMAHTQLLKWNTMTVRCADHETMDELVRALQIASRCKVVPFSSNPCRERAKNMAAQKRNGGSSLKNLFSPPLGPQKVSMDVDVDGAKRSTTRAEQDANAIVNKIVSTPHSQAVRRLGTSIPAHDATFQEEPITTPKLPSSTLAIRKSLSRRSSNASSSLVGQQSQRTKTQLDTGSSHNKTMWSNADECEFCGLHFTLLSRRHHCRKCEHSCCEDCSIVVYLSGGEETRLCNRCNSSVLVTPHGGRKKKGRHTRSDSTCLLGKIHESCTNQGVGTMGVLPDWKNYVSFCRDARPAVGRITIEVMEALALKRIDLNLKCNPYVRATITGYDYDLEWNLVEWDEKYRFSLTTSYCSSTLSPVWRGPGKMGGQLLTLPVVSSSSAVLRLEALHFDGITNAAGVDTVIGMVEIPLSDIPNANLRTSEEPLMSGYDGFVERWFHLETRGGAEECTARGVVLARPIANPIAPLSTRSEQANHSRRERDQRQNCIANKLARTMDEIGQWGENVCKVPTEWIGAAFGIDMPRVMASDRDKRRTKSSVHVRIKLNLSEMGDFISHAWFPPVRERPKRPTFDPEKTYAIIMYIAKKAEPYTKFFKSCEKCIKWKRPPMTCVYFYLVVVFHVAMFHRLIYLLHIYLVLYLLARLIRMNREPEDNQTRRRALDDATEVGSSMDRSLSQETVDSLGSNERRSLPKKRETKSRHCPPSPSLSNLGQHQLRSAVDIAPVQEKEQDEGDTGLHKIIFWAAKRWLSSRGMDALQFKLGLLSHDITVINSIWDGSNKLLTAAVTVVMIVSCLLHCMFNVRYIWILIITVAHFGPSPILQKFLRFNFGINRGVAKILRRRHLHLLEEETYKLSNRP
jgi:hypothetical protein